MVNVLFQDYVHWWQQTSAVISQRAKHPMKMPKLNSEKQLILEDFVRLCEKEKLEPRLWLYTLFAAKKFVWLVAFKRGHLLSLTSRWAYKKMDAARFRNRLTMDTLEARWDALQDLNSTVEGIKEIYLQSGQSERCMEEMKFRTLGFHPKSAICLACPTKAACRAKLADVMGPEAVRLRGIK